MMVTSGSVRAQEAERTTDKEESGKTLPWISQQVQESAPDCQEKLDYCVNVARNVVEQANQYIGALTNELQMTQKLNGTLQQGYIAAKEEIKAQKQRSKTNAAILAIVSGAAAGALLSTQQKDFSMVSGALAGGLVAGGTTALLQAVIEF